MARQLREDVAAPFAVYEDDPTPPWYTRLYEQVTGQRPLLKTGQSDWQTLTDRWRQATAAPTGPQPSMDLERPLVTDVPAAQTGYGRTLASYREKVPADAGAGVVGPVDPRADLEKGLKEGEEQARFWGEILAGVVASGLLPVAAVPTAMRLLASSPLGALYRTIAPSLARRAVIALAPALVDVATGAPEQAPSTFGWSLAGEFMGGAPSDVARRVGPGVARRLGESPQGRTAAEVLASLEAPVTLGTRSGSEGAQRLEETLRKTFGGGPLRKARQQGEAAVTGEITALAEGGLPQRPVSPPSRPTPATLPEETTGRLGLPRPGGTPMVEDVTLTWPGLTSQPPHVVVRNALEEQRRVLGQAEAIRYGAVDDVIMRQRPATGGARVPPPRGQPFTPPVDVPPSPSPRPDLPPAPQPPIVTERRPVWAEPGSTRPGQSWLREVPGQERVPGREPLWTNVPEEVPYDPASTEARYGTRRFEDVSPRERPTPGPASPSPYVNAQPAKAIARALQGDIAGLRVPGAEDLLNQVLAKPDRLTFADMQQLRSDLLRVTRQAQDLIPDKAARYAGQIEGAIDKEMAQTARAFGTDTYNEWRAANDFYKGNAQLFQTPAVQNLLGAESDKVFGRAAQAGQPYSIRAARQAINNPLVWQEVQDAWTRQMVRSFSDPLTGAIHGPQMLQYLKQTFGEVALKELFPGGHGQRLLDLATTLAQLQRRGEGASALQRVIHWTPTGGLTFPLLEAYDAFVPRQEGQGRPAWLTKVALGATVFAFTPAVLARVMANPELSRWVVQGMKVSPTAQGRMETGGMLLSLLAREGLLEPQSAPETAGTP